MYVYTFAHAHTHAHTHGRGAGSNNVPTRHGPWAQACGWLCQQENKRVLDCGKATLIGGGLYLLSCTFARTGAINFSLNVVYRIITLCASG